MEVISNNKNVRQTEKKEENIICSQRLNEKNFKPKIKRKTDKMLKKCSKTTKNVARKRKRK